MKNLNPLYENTIDFYSPEIVLPNAPEKYFIYVSMLNNKYKISLKPAFMKVKLIPKNIIDLILKVYLHFRQDNPQYTRYKLLIYQNHINDIIPILPRGTFQRAWI